MHGTFLPPNRTLLIMDPWRHVLVDPQGNQVGWDGPAFVRPDGSTLVVSPRDRGRLVRAGVVENTRDL